MEKYSITKKKKKTNYNKYTANKKKSVQKIFTWNNGKHGLYVGIVKSLVEKKDLSSKKFLKMADLKLQFVVKKRIALCRLLQYDSLLSGLLHVQANMRSRKGSAGRPYWMLCLDMRGCGGTMSCKFSTISFGCIKVSVIVVTFFWLHFFLLSFMGCHFSGVFFPPFRSSVLKPHLWTEKRKKKKIQI